MIGKGDSTNSKVHQSDKVRAAVAEVTFGIFRDGQIEQLETKRTCSDLLAAAAAVHTSGIRSVKLGAEKIGLVRAVCITRSWSRFHDETCRLQ